MGSKPAQKAPVVLVELEPLEEVLWFVRALNPGPAMLCRLNQLESSIKLVRDNDVPHKSRELD